MAVSTIAALVINLVSSSFLPLDEYTLIQSDPMMNYSFSSGYKTLQAGESMTLVNEMHITGSNNFDILWSWFVNPLGAWPFGNIACPHTIQHEETQQGPREDMYWETASWSSAEVFKNNQTNAYYSRQGQTRYGSFVK